MYTLWYTLDRCFCVEYMPRFGTFEFCIVEGGGVGVVGVTLHRGAPRSATVESRVKGAVCLTEYRRA